MINIEKRGKRIEIRTDDPLPGFRTAIPGAYQSVYGYWTVPLTLETCLLLRQRYGKRLKIGMELRRWANGIRASREQMSALAIAADVELELLPDAAPMLYKAMTRRKYQKVGARFVADNSACLVADEPGLGKTLIAMGGIIEAGVKGPYLIVAPKTAARPVWWREIRRWLPRWHKPIVFPEGRLARTRKFRTTTLDEDTWVIVHPEMVIVRSYFICDQCGKHSLLTQKTRRKMACGHIKSRKTKRTDVPIYPKMFSVEWGAIVVDESHESLIRRSGVPTLRRNGLDRLQVRQDGLRICLSGTPMNNKPYHLWGTLNWLYPKVYTSINSWTGLYWTKGGYNGYQVKDFIKEREQMLWDSLSSICLRRTKLEVAKDLPPKMEIGSPLEPSKKDSPVGIWLDMDGRQAKAYEDMLKHSATELKSGRLEAITALAELTRLKQLACSYGDIQTKAVWVTDENGHGHKEFRYKFVPSLPSNKFRFCVETLEEWGFPSNPIDKVIFVSFYTGLLEFFASRIDKHFQTKPGKSLSTAITGRIQSSAKRAKIIERFNNHGNEHIMMLNVKAGGNAITIDSACRMIFLSETRIPDQQTQAEDRIHRVSNPRQCMYLYLRSLGTVDVGTAIANQELAQDSYELLDRRRGVEYLRYVIEHSKS